MTKVVKGAHSRLAALTSLATAMADRDGKGKSQTCRVAVQKAMERHGGEWHASVKNVRCITG